MIRMFSILHSHVYPKCTIAYHGMYSLIVVTYPEMYNLKWRLAYLEHMMTPGMYSLDEQTAGWCISMYCTVKEESMFLTLGNYYISQWFKVYMIALLG